MSAEQYLFLIPLLPLIGATINGLFGKKLPQGIVGPIACLGPILAFVLSVIWFFDAKALAEGTAITNELFTWIKVGDLELPLAFSLDRLSSMMLLVVTGVGSLIHIYSMGYMKDDKGFSKFFAYLNLFMTMMLVLVLGNNMPLLFLGWEGVGLCSYLLIGFWYEDINNSQAGKKAFVVNRIGDLAFAIGMFLAFTTYGSLDFTAINLAAEAGTVNGEPISDTAKFWIPLLFFIGATGKSAQIPLFVWLPDAMAGPTPVSALIHAATMVTSGIYLLNRAQPVFNASPEVLMIIAVVGALTALVAGFIALGQFDIKKVLAYSTVSQLGYMFLACGLGSFYLGMFHVVTHAFFKGLLFLGAGAVIYSCHHEQDMRKMGGLRKKIPFTFILMLIGSLALAGAPFMAGFMSKDAILVKASELALAENTYPAFYFGLWAIGLVTAGMTAFYSFRMMAMTFFGPANYEEHDAHASAHSDADSPLAQDHGHGHDDHGHDHHHGGPIVESPKVMLAPMAILAVLAIIGGHLYIEKYIHHSKIEYHVDHNFYHWLGVGIGSGIFLAGLLAVTFLYGKGSALRDALVNKNPIGQLGFHFSNAKLYIDEIYNFLIVKPLGFISWALFLLIDRALIDEMLVKGAGLIACGFGSILRTVQTGRIPNYAGWVVGGAVVVMIIILAAGAAGP